MNNKERMKQILKETVDYYAEDPDNRRSIDKDGNCNYTWGDTHCAVGRYLKPEYQKESWEENNSSVFQLAQFSDDYDIDQFLIEKAQGLDLGFWSNLQDFHDSHSRWITEEDYNKDEEPIGLSRIGKDNYRVIERKINMGGYHD